MPWLNRFAPYEHDYSVQPGAAFTRFPLPDPRSDRVFTFGVVICYEDTISQVSRPYGREDGGPPADFLLNISNDGWFDGTSEHDEHLALCRFRAIECRRSVARAVNMGISALIDSNGRVLLPAAVMQAKGKEGAPVWRVPAEQGKASELPVERWSEFKKVPAVLLATIPIDNRVSFYAQWGDWLPTGCWVILLGVIVVVRIRRVKPSRV
jgi:apolipoprotein N-acyltransferase